MIKVKNFFKRITCNHSKDNLIFIRNIHGDEINHINSRSIWQCSMCGKIIFEDSVYDAGNISDGYHTFNELYHHRAILFAVICNKYKNKCWKSLKHNDGSMYHDMFIVGIYTSKGPATYHYDLKYWDLFNVNELPVAPKWDGHTPADAINRIESLLYLN